MCMNCGCGQVEERHGNQANIIADDLRRAGEANGQDLSTTVRHLQDSLGKVSSTSGGSMRSSGSMGASSTGGGWTGGSGSTRGTDTGR